MKFHKKLKILFISLFFVIIFFKLNNLFICDNTIDYTADPNLERAQSEIILTNPLEPFYIESSIPINIIFIGFDSVYINTSYINNSLEDLIKPTYREIIDDEIKSSYMGAIYNLEYNYYFSDGTSLELDFANYLTSIETDILPPYQLLKYNPTATTAKEYSAVDAITWLDNNINNYFSEINNSYCFYLIDLYTHGLIQDYHYYSIVFEDTTIGSPSIIEYTILYGGEIPNRGVFLDLSAGPIYHYDFIPIEDPMIDGVSPEEIPPIWEYSFPLDKDALNNEFIEYIRDLSNYIFLPCYVYEPMIYEEKNNIRIVIFDNTTGNLFSSNPNNYIDKNLVKSCIEELIPNSQWDVSIHTESIYNFPELERLIMEVKNSSIIQSRIYENITAYLKNFYNELGIFEDTIPVFMFALPENIIDARLGITGVSLFERVIVIDGGYDSEILTDHTNLIVHEVGHEIGLLHPFNYYTIDKDNMENLHVDFLFNFISTPMSYLHSDTSYSTFDRDAIARAHSFKYINKTWELLNIANTTLLNNGFTNLDPFLEKELNYIFSNQSFFYNTYESEDFIEAQSYAKKSYLSAQLYYEYAITLLQNNRLGDVNNDGNVDIVDAMLIAQYYVGITPEIFYPEVADVNGDGIIDINDALLVAQLYVGIIDEFPINP